MTYLNFPQAWSFSPVLCSVSPTASFVEYAACDWGIHAWQETTKNVKTLAPCNNSTLEDMCSSYWLSSFNARSWGRPFGLGGTPRGFTGLHGTACFGCAEIIVALLETNKQDVQATSLRGNTAITWAARCGHEEAVRVLLERSDDSPD